MHNHSLSQLRNFRIYLDYDWLRRLCFLHSGFYFAQAGGQCSLKSSFETFSYPSEECEALIRDFPFIGKYFFPVEDVKIMKARLYPYLTISQAMKTFNDSPVSDQQNLLF